MSGEWKWMHNISVRTTACESLSMVKGYREFGGSHASHPMREKRLFLSRHLLGSDLTVGPAPGSRSLTRMRLDPIMPAIRIPTGNQQLDQALGGGIERGIITEFFGPSGVGKSTLMHTLCVSCRQSSRVSYRDEGVGSRVLYIDTPGSKFNPQLLARCVTPFGADFNDVMNTTLVQTARSTSHQLVAIYQAEKLIEEGTNEFGLLILDSLMYHYRAEYDCTIRDRLIRTSGTSE